MAHIVTLNNGKNVTMSVATDESLYKSLSYYIQKELGNEFYSYLNSYVQSLIEDNKNLGKYWTEAEESVDELDFEKDEMMQIVREAYTLIDEEDLESAKSALGQILNY